MLEGLVHGGASAHNGTSCLQGVRLGDQNAEMLMHDSLCTVAAFGLHPLRVCSRPAVGVLPSIRHRATEGAPAMAHVLVSRLASAALEASVHHATHTHMVTDLDLRDVLSHVNADTSELMTWRSTVCPIRDAHQIFRSALSPDDVTMAHAAVLHLDQHVIVTDGPALEAHWLEVTLGAKAGHANGIDRLPGLRHCCFSDSG
mmetsp:Transcript_133681/g.236643  ORF Transcript_133681/g.236643 Transcript_133681/m.236643 type:complete len:201 (-) Transcript_133681:25-627(-)